MCHRMNTWTPKNKLEKARLEQWKKANGETPFGEWNKKLEEI